MSCRTTYWIGLVIVALSAAAAPATANQFGINGHIPGPAVADRIAEAGIGWVRVDMIWAVVEPEPDRFEWTLYDQTLTGLKQRGVKVYATLQGTPAWATDGDEFSGVPRDTDRWRRFCYRAAHRYRDLVDAWGMWNEPNLGRFWQGSRTQYVYDILLAGLDAIEIADPEAFIAAPDLAHLQSGDWDSWLRTVISAAGSRLDAVSHHTYPSDGSAADVTRKLVSGSSYPWDPPAVREVLQSTGWWGKPFWLLETGVESARHSEVGQERFFAELLADWFGPFRRQSWVDRIFFYEMHDDPNAGSTFGIVGPLPDLEPKLAFDAYREFVQSAEVDDAVVEGCPVELIVPSAGRVAVDVTWRNTGATSWRSNDGYAIVAEIDQPGWTITGGALPPQRTVHPGTSVTVTVDLQAPTLAPEQDPVRARFTARLRRSFSWPFGDAAQSRITHTDGSLPVARATPRTQVIAEGRPATLSISLDDPRALLRWYRDGAPLIESSRVRGTFRDTLEMTEVEVADDGDYHCVVRNRVGPVTVFAGRLRVVSSATEVEADPRQPSGRVSAVLDRWRFWRDPRAVTAQGPERSH